MNKLFNFKIQFAILLFICISSSALYSKTILLDDSLKKMPIGLYTNYLTDIEGNLTIDDIQNPAIENKWIAAESEVPGFGYLQPVYWVRFTIENITGSEIEFYLEEAYPLIEDLQIYIPGDNKFKVIKAGHKLPFHERPIEYKNFVFPLKIKAHTAATYYLRFDTESALNIYLFIWSPPSFQKHIIRESIFTWMFYGIMLIMALYNLFLFFSIRDNSYFYYILYIISFGIFMMVMEGLAFQFLWPNSVWWAKRSVNFFVGIVNFSIIMFAIYYINIWQYLKTSFDRRVLIVVKIMVFFSLVHSISISMFASFNIAVLSSALLTAINCFLGFIILVLSIVIYNSREGKLFLTAFLLFLFGALIFALKEFSIVPVTFITYYSLQIGAVLNVILLSLALSDRINKIRKELQMSRDELADLNKNLEETVSNRTSELQNANDELELMNEALISINMELEDIQRKAGIDMLMAANVQSRLFQEEVPKTKGWDIAFAFKPLSGVSGDLYDFYTENENLTGVSLFDVSGHGIASGLITMIARSVFSKKFEEGVSLELNKILEQSNLELIRELDKVDNYLTGIILRFNGNTVEYVNAGHTDLICKRAKSGEISRIDLENGKIKGKFIGIDYIKSIFKSLHFDISENDLLVLYSDCLIENKNSKGEVYGTKGIMSSLNNIHNASAHEYLDLIMVDFHNHIDDSALKDDLTVIVLRRTV